MRSDRDVLSATQLLGAGAIAWHDHMYSTRGMFRSAGRTCEDDDSNRRVIPCVREAEGHLVHCSTATLSPLIVMRPGHITGANSTFGTIYNEVMALCWLYGLTCPRPEGISLLWPVDRDLHAIENY